MPVGLSCRRFAGCFFSPFEFFDPMLCFFMSRSPFNCTLECVFTGKLNAIPPEAGLLIPSQFETMRRERELTNRFLTGAVQRMRAARSVSVIRDWGLIFALTFTSLQALALDDQRELSRYGRQTWQTESG